MALTLRQARRLAEKSQKELADMVGMHVQTYRKIELSPENATVKQAIEISEALGVSYDDIFFSQTSSLTRKKSLTRGNPNEQQAS